MYVCHHCGHISREPNVTYCTNINCKYYNAKGSAQQDISYKMSQMPQYEKNVTQKRSLKGDSMTFNYDGDINYPSDKRHPSMGNAGFDYAMAANLEGKKTSDYGYSADYDRLNTDYKAAEYKMPNMSADYEKPTNSCGALAFATVPKQKFERLYSPKEALMAGTVFKSLNMPYNKKIIRRG